MTFWPVVLSFITLTLVVVFFVVKASRYETKLPKNTKKIPVMQNRIPLVQHAKILTQEQPRILDFFKETTDKCGDIWKVYLPTTLLTKPKTMVITCIPEILQFVLSTGFKQGLFAKGADNAEQYKEFLGRGIFTSNGERWKGIREFASGLFHVGSLKQYVDIFDANAKNLFESVEKLSADEESAAKGIDMQDYFMRYTLDAFSEIGFGVRINSMQEEVNHFALAFDDVQLHAMLRNSSGPYIWRIKEAISPPKSYQASLAYMNDYVNSIIQQRKQDSPDQLRERGDLISRLLMATESEFAATDEDLRDFVMNFLIAGRDTTAVLLTWCVYLLSQNPHVEEKLLKEFESVIGDEAPSYVNTKNLKYCKQVLQETLRLFPPVPVDGFVSQADCMLPGNYFVEKDTTVLYCAYDLHRRKEIWGEDAEEFKPERFDNAPAPFTWIPFHAGPRECLGKEMAYLEAKVMLVNLLRKYKLSLHPGHPIELKRGIILTSTHGMRMDLTPRDK